MKEYKIEITYIEDKNMNSMSILVNGKKKDLPPTLEHWIAEAYTSKLFAKERNSK